MFASSKIILFKSVVQHGRQRLFKFIIDQIQKSKKSEITWNQMRRNDIWAGPLQISNYVLVCETICINNSSF